mgnify:CR=1 FL=1
MWIHYCLSGRGGASDEQNQEKGIPWWNIELANTKQLLTFLLLFLVLLIIFEISDLLPNYLMLILFFANIIIFN